MAFTAAPLAGEIVSAAKWQALFGEVRPISSRLTVDTSAVNNSTVLVNSGLSVAMGTNKVYDMFLSILYNGLSAAADLKVAFTYPTGATALINALGVTTADVFGYTMAAAESTSFTFGTSAAANRAAILYGQWVTSSTAGNLVVQWAQNTNTAVDSKLLAGSRLILRQQE